MKPCANHLARVVLPTAVERRAPKEGKKAWTQHKAGRVLFWPGRGPGLDGIHATRACVVRARTMGAHASERLDSGCSASAQITQHCYLIE
jgi:hypothetical protein